jgi:hypothetical protein
MAAAENSRTSILRLIDGEQEIIIPVKKTVQLMDIARFFNTKMYGLMGSIFTTLFIGEEKDNVLRKTKLPRQDVILRTRGTTQRCVSWTALNLKASASIQGCLFFRPTTGSLDLHLFEVFRSGIAKAK